MRLLFLLQHCKPDVRENIERFTYKDPTKGYRLAWQTLFVRNGQPHVIAQWCEQQLKKAPDVKPHDPKSLTKLSVLMDKCLTYMQGIVCVSRVDSMEVMLAVLKKLPASLQEKRVKVISIRAMNRATSNIYFLGYFRCRGEYKRQLNIW